MADVVLTVARATTVPFEEGFFEDPDTQTVPIVPIDPAQYPAVTIRSPDGQIVKSGVATPIIPGVWRFEFMIPADAMLSSPAAKWSIEWVILNAAGRTHDARRYFDVVETKVASAEDRAPTLLVRQGGKARLVLRRQADPFELTAALYGFMNDTALASYSWLPTDPIGTTIKRVVDKDDIAFYFDTPALDTGEYQVFWAERITELSQTDETHRLIRSVPNVAWFLFPSLRALVDKLRKRAERLQAYTTAELYDYLLAGVGILNSIHPRTNFGLIDGPHNFDIGSRTALYYAAALHALRAQHILAVETEFDFGGQTVPLKVDRRAGYAEAIEKMQDALKNWAVAKLALFRSSNRVGANAVRMPQRRFQQFVIPISQGAGGETFALLSGLSLL